jgi:hypothetical protein
MINHIDVSSVLRRTVCDLYSNLVTRSTGAAVRTEIENLLADLRDPTLTIIDFTHVNLLDFSCADEVVAKLLLRYGTAEPPLEAYFVVRGVRDAHLDAIESVLERYGLALVVQCEGAEPQLIGSVGDGERRTWQMLSRLGRAAAEEVATELGEEPGRATQVLEGLRQRRLVMRLDELYVALGNPA